VNEQDEGCSLVRPEPVILQNLPEEGQRVVAHLNALYAGGHLADATADESKFFLTQRRAVSCGFQDTFVYGKYRHDRILPEPAQILKPPMNSGGNF